MLFPEFLAPRKHQLLSLSLTMFALLAPAVPANACGPFFINRLLVDRNNTLLYMPEGNFAFEANTLVDIDKTLPVWEEATTITTENEIKDHMTAEELRVSSIIEQMRASSSIQQANALSKGLSSEERLYTLGAVAFKLMDPKAVDYFTQLLALPKSEQELYGLDAQYSLGRALMEDYSNQEQDDSTQVRSPHPSETQLTLALNAFQKVIDQVKNGESEDPTFLSLSSLGQQAKIHLWLGDIPTATHLYAQQAAQGYRGGNVSLRYVANMLMKPQNDKLLAQALKDPVVQQLVTIQLFSNNWSWQDDEHSNDKKQITAKILTQISSSANHGFKGGDRLAALAYRSGNYDMAATLLKNADDSALSWWLRAKMALRNGDEKVATIAYAKAAEGFPSSERWATEQDDPEMMTGSNIQPACRVAGEQGILALNRGDYLQAMELFYRGKDIYRADLMDIAERVLTIDELKQFIDNNVSPTVDNTPASAEVQEYYGLFGTPDTELREVLARRLMRAKRYNEAFMYFQPANRQWAKQFINNLNAAHNLKAGTLARAQAYYQAALLLRKQGLELISYEMTPDYAIYGANYSYVGDSYNLSYRTGDNWLRDEASADDRVHPPVKIKNWITARELARAQAALPKTNNRFLHYRWEAVDLASKAADLLPPQSQAYTAILCNAQGWIINRDPKGGLKIFRRYTKKGSFYQQSVHSQANFTCPDPDFTQRH